MGHRLARQAQADIDDIAYYVFVESGNLEPADRLIESLTARFALLAAYPRAGRRRDDLRLGARAFPVGDYVGATVMWRCAESCRESGGHVHPDVT